MCTLCTQSQLWQLCAQFMQIPFKLFALQFQFRNKIKHNTTMRMDEQGKGAGRYLPTNESNLFKFLQQKQTEYSWYPWYYCQFLPAPLTEIHQRNCQGEKSTGRLSFRRLPACLPALPKSTPLSICTLINWNIAAGSHCFQFPVASLHFHSAGFRLGCLGSPWSLPARCPGSALSLGHKNSFPVVTHSWQSKWCQNRKSSYLGWVQRGRNQKKGISKFAYQCAQRVLHWENWKET